MTEVIAEIGLQHDGSLREAFAFIRACSQRGADVVKFQCHAGDPNAHFRPGTEHEFPQDESRFRYWQRTGFNGREWQRIKQECDDCGVEFLCTPFSVTAVELIDPLVRRWKIGSGNVQDAELLAAVYATNKPIIFSNGFRQAVHYELRARGTLEMACISKYPTPLQESLQLLREVRHSPSWGWSSHTGVIDDSELAAACGAKAIEVHVCWSKEQGGPDVSSAITVDDLGRLIATVRRMQSIREAA